ncbi:FAD-dependent monooxygenase [Pseudonocardia eucalypti]|uniref:FAD-dependent monooxygenase n=1 Tax=Pseudonocardia eucalypti TaxID=648755 RepID=A0ABP9PEX0_9PSEU|nr:anthraniloyl-CoA monooxygenase [Pseudonocardia eucalypti]
MKIICIGAGPAGLYFAILSKLRDPACEVTVVERNPRGVTHGWGVVFWDDLVHGLRRSDPVTCAAILDVANQWHDQEVQVGRPSGAEKPARMGGYGYSVGRAQLLDILTRRAESLGVKVEFEHSPVDASDFPDAELVVAADGAGSVTRTRFAEHFKPTVESANNYYIWLGTRKLFNIFTFAFEESPAGWVWLHGYRFSDEYSTCIFECSPHTFAGLGLDTLSEEDGLAKIRSLFARELDGQELINKGSPWLRFTDVSNQHWYHGNMVLMGDAAHTTHFSIGSGTKLAMEDAIGLDVALRGSESLPDALATYQADRSAAVAVRQAAARTSTEWFENVAEHIKTDPVRFSYALRTRREEAGGLSWLAHRATQYRAGQTARRWVSTAKRRLRPT